MIYRELSCAMETKEYAEWKNSGAATRESCPLHIKAYELVPMIEKSAYEAALHREALLLGHLDKIKDCKVLFQQFRDSHYIQSIDDIIKHALEQNRKLRE